MSEAPRLEDDGVTTSRPALACFTCKRRKIRCDRSLPSCSLCIKTLQQCKYPLTPQKPGPKIGAPQRRKRRHLLDGPHTTGRGHHSLRRPSGPTTDAAAASHNNHQAFRKLNQAGALSYLRTYHPRNQLLIQLTDKDQMNIL